MDRAAYVAQLCPGVAHSESATVAGSETVDDTLLAAGNTVRRIVLNRDLLASRAGSGTVEFWQPALGSRAFPPALFAKSAIA